MLSIEDKKVLAELGRHNHGRVLRNYLNDKLLGINSVEDAKSWEDTLARQHAVRLIKEIFAVLEDHNTKVNSKTKYD